MHRHVGHPRRDILLRRRGGKSNNRRDSSSYIVLLYISSFLCNSILSWMGEHHICNNSVECWHYREAQNPIKCVKCYSQAICRVETALLTTTPRLIPSMLTRLPLRVKSPPRKTYRYPITRYMSLVPLLCILLYIDYVM